MQFHQKPSEDSEGLPDNQGNRKMPHQNDLLRGSYPG